MEEGRGEGWRREGGKETERGRGLGGRGRRRRSG